MESGVEVLPDASLVADALATQFVAAAENAIRSSGVFVVALSGGDTPRGAYARLAAEPYASRVDWARVVVLWGDERCVPPDDAASNFRMARESLLDHVPVLEANVHRIQGEVDAAAAAAAYEEVLRTVLRTPVGPPRLSPGSRIDFVLLGLGDDGHTASLFPEEWENRHDGQRWVMATRSRVAPMGRVTLTPIIINAAAEVVFLVLGRAKAAIVRRVLEGPHRPYEVPAQRIAPTAGSVRWFLDAPAASELRQRGSR